MRGNRNLFPKAQLLLQKRFHLSPGRNGFGSFHFPHSIGQSFLRTLLVFQQFDIQVCIRITQSQTSGFVVGSYKNQGLIRMFLVEFISQTDTLVKVDSFRNNRSRIMGMSRPIYLATLYHHKETFLRGFRKVVQTGFCQIRQTQVFFRPIQCIFQASANRICRKQEHFVFHMTTIISVHPPIHSVSFLMKQIIKTRS